MVMTRRVRSSAILLLLALLGGGIGLPLFDALVFHSSPGSRTPAERVLAQEGSARTHVQVCQLNHAVPAERSLAGRPTAVPALAVPETAARFAPQPAGIPAAPLSSQLSRAPPSA